MLVIMQGHQENKMVWYKLVFKQNQPIHIGYIDWGVVNETQIFIPGWTMWGALTKAYNICNSKPLSDNQDLFETITCFYPCFNAAGDEVLFPEYKNGEFYLGEYSEDKFRLEFVDVFVSTAVHPHSRQAVENSLHEIEYILPKSKKIKPKDSSKQLYWVGLLGIEENQNQQKIEKFLKKGQKIFVGGEQKYGFGELELIKFEQIDDLSRWGLKNDASLEPNKPLRNYLIINQSINLSFEGEIKLVAEYNFSENKLTIGYCINVGSKVNGDNSAKFILKKGKLIKQGG